MVDSNRQLAEVNSQLEKLESENRRLSGQVKRLLMAEWDLSRLQGQLDTQIRLYRQLYEVGKIFNATFDLGEILETATRFVLYELNFERCLVLLRSDQGERFCVRVLDGYYDEDVRQRLADLCLSAGEPTLLPLRSGSLQVICSETCDQEHLQALGRVIEMVEYVIFPLGGEPRNPDGLLVAGNGEENLGYHTRVHPDSEFVVGLANLASMATITINNVDLYTSLARLHEERIAMLRHQVVQVTTAQEEERQRIARELHDGVGPTLASLTMRLRAARNRLERDGHSAAEELEELAQLTDASISDISRLIHDLRPAALDMLGLGPALREYIARYQVEQRMNVALVLPNGDERLPAPLETVLFRIIQEALTNVAKHAQARRVAVTLACEQDVVTLCVSDDGRGFDPQAPRSGTHLGLWSIGVRVEQLGGRFEIESAPGRGTGLAITIPLT
jgi:signal transduction histidine kinase